MTLEVSDDPRDIIRAMSQLAERLPADAICTGLTTLGYSLPRGMPARELLAQVLSVIGPPKSKRRT